MHLKANKVGFVDFLLLYHIHLNRKASENYSSAKSQIGKLGRLLLLGHQ